MRGSSFIDIARLKGAKSLVGEFNGNPGRFDSCLKGMKIDSIGNNGDVSCSLEVSDAFKNGYGTLHGGAIASIVDVVGTLSILSVDNTKPGVSVDINVSYVGAAKADSKVLIEGQLIKLGRRLAYTQVSLKDEKGQMIAIGRHTKFVG